jgi:cytoskeleton protein RodZ
MINSGSDNQRAAERIPLMSAFGENLRREREMRGVSLEEISAATKISVRLLQAIENEDFAKLPGGIFTRSFIRSYSRYLGLDEEAVLGEYQMAAPARADIDLGRLSTSRPGGQRSGSKTPLIALVLAAAMLAGGYALFRYSRRAAEISGPVPATTFSAPPTPAAQPSASPAATEAVPPGSSGPPLVASSQSGPTGNPSPQGAGPAPPAGTDSTAAGTSTAPQLPDTQGGLVLQIAATDRAWTAVEADGKMTLQRVLAPNEVVTFRARDSFDITTGNAQGVILTLNGETLKPLGRRGEVKSIHLTHNDVKNPAP